MSGEITNEELKKYRKLTVKAVCPLCQKPLADARLVKSTVEETLLYGYCEGKTKRDSHKVEIRITDE